jgi:hypothetical protein
LAFFSGLSVCDGVIVAEGCGTNCGGGTTVIPGCCAEGGWVVLDDASLNLRLLGSGIGGLLLVPVLAPAPELVLGLEVLNGGYDHL